MSTFLFGTPSWLEAGRAFDLVATFDEDNRSHTPDALAVKADFQAVGADFWTALAILAAGLVAAAVAARSSAAA
ncbi:MAG: hypothetical protein ACYDGY_00075 [Acidimicrobiales bacterium]